MSLLNVYNVKSVQFRTVYINLEINNIVINIHKYTFECKKPKKPCMYKDLANGNKIQ